MAKELILVDFDPTTGSPTVSVEGVKGKACKDLTAQLEKALGSVTSDVHTAEFAQRPMAGHQQSVKH